jgi:hypothetical protein
MTIDIKTLKSFCVRDSVREIIRKPFSYGDYTYATNGIVAVRVPRIEDVIQENRPSIEKLFSNFSFENMVSFKVKIPMGKKAECLNCGGSRTEHDCPYCKCECESCDGKGLIVEKVYIDVAGTVFEGKYLRLLQSLPNVKIAPVKEKVCWFVFDGGDGAIMPIRNLRGLAIQAAIINSKVGE